MAQVILRPNGWAGSATNVFDASAKEWSRLADQDDATYVESSTDNSGDTYRYELDDPPADFEEHTAFRLFGRVSLMAAGDDLWEVRVSLRDGANVLIGATDWYTVTGTAWQQVEFSPVYASKPASSWQVYRVAFEWTRSQNMGGDGNRVFCSDLWVQVDYTPVPAPTSSPTPTLTPSYTSMLLEWAAVPDATSYRIQRSLDGVTGWTVITTTSNLSHTDSGLDYDTTYHYRVEAYSAGGSAGYGTPASATTLPAPTNVAALPVLVPDGNVQVQWTGNGFADVDEGVATFDGVYISTPGGDVDKYTLQNTPDDFDTMWTCAVRLRYWVDTGAGTIYGRIETSTGVILAAANSTGDMQTFANESAQVDWASALVQFSYLNDTATKAQWDDAVLHLSAGTAELGTAFRVDAIQAEGEYLTSGPGDTPVAGVKVTEVDTARPGTTTVVANLTGAQAVEADTARAGATNVDKQVAGTAATEVDTARPGTVTVDVTVAGVQAAEVDTARAGVVAVALSVAGTQASEVDTARAGVSTVGKDVAGTAASEADTARSGAVAVDATVGGVQAVETDTGRAGSTTVVANLPGTQAVEADTARPGTASVGERVAGVQATEVDTARPGGSTVVANVAGAQAVEIDTARAGTAEVGERVAGVRATETDTPRPGSITVDAHLAGAQATEVDTAAAGAPGIGAAGTAATETDTARPGAVSTAGGAVGVQAVEVDTARPGTVTVDVNVAGVTATEVDTARPGRATSGATGATATETDTARPGGSTVDSHLAGTTATEADVARPGSVTVALAVGGTLAAEVDTARPGTTTVTAGIVGARVIEVDTARPGAALVASDHQLALLDATYVVPPAGTAAPVPPSSTAYAVPGDPSKRIPADPTRNQR